MSPILENKFQMGDIILLHNGLDSGIKLKRCGCHFYMGHCFVLLGKMHFQLLYIYIYMYTVFAHV